MRTARSPESIQGQCPASPQAAHRSLDQPTKKGSRSKDHRPDFDTKLMLAGVSKSLTHSGAGLFLNQAMVSASATMSAVICGLIV
jgi:hypothetical protein